MSVTPEKGRHDRRTTIKEVAELAGVSKAAVSMAFNDRPGISATTRQRILEAAEVLGWTPSRLARSLSVSAAHADTVGLVVRRHPQQAGARPLSMEFVSGIESVLEEHSSSLLMRMVRDADQEIAIQRDWWQSRRIAGSILVDLRTDDHRIPKLAALGIPAVAVGHPTLTGPFAPVWTDDGTAVQEAVRYLAAVGHRRIARVGGHEAFGDSAIRAAALNDIAEELGLQETRSIPIDLTGEQGARATRMLLASAVPPTAIIYDNDLTAVAGLSVAAEMGLEVPEDVSLLAWGDSQLCQVTRPTLSAMSHDVFAFGADVARRMFDVIDHRPVSGQPVATPVLVPRGSTGHPRS